MTRRNTRRNARGSLTVRSPRQRIIQTLPYSYFRSDSYTVDGDTGKVAALTDCVASGTGIRAAYPDHSLVQSNTTYQVALPAASAVFSGKSVLTMSNAMYISDALAGAFNCLHSGDGSKVYIVASADSVAAGTQYLLATSTTTGEGQNFGRLTASFFNALYSATPALISSVADGTMVADTAHVLAASYLEGGTPEVSLQAGDGAATTGSTSGAPGPGDASAQLRLGCRLTGNSPWVGKFAAMAIFDRIPTAGEDAIVRSALFAEYGAL